MPQTKILQIVDNLVKQADNADTLDGKHASEFASASDVETLKTQVGDTSVSEQIDTALKGNQADWNQNDETAADYVKNRPFYTGDLVETYVVQDASLVYLGVENSVNSYNFPSSFNLVAGTTYKVYWNGVVYECVCSVFGGSTFVIGNLSIAEIGDDTGEPFIIVTDNQSVYKCYTTVTADSIVVSISFSTQEIVKIDEKYLPETAFTNAKWDCISEKPIEDSVDIGISVSSFTQTFDGIFTGAVYSNKLFDDELLLEKGYTYSITGTISLVSKDIGNTYSLDISDYFTCTSQGILYLGDIYCPFHEESLRISLCGSNHYQKNVLRFDAYTFKGEQTITVTDFNIVRKTKTLDKKYIPNLFLSNENPKGTGRFSLNRLPNSSAGLYSFAEGYMCEASDDCCHAEGYNTIAASDYQHAQGKYNIKDARGSYAHIVGNGSFSERSNAHTLDWSGNAWFSGDVYTGSTSGKNKDEGSKKLATEDYVSTQISAIPTPDVSGQISTHNSDSSAHSDIRTSVSNLSSLIGDTAVSTQINEAIKDKANTSDLTSHTSNKSNPHEVTKAQVGLDNVTNDAQVKRTEMGTASGVATLDANKKVPVDQLPTANAETYGIIRTTEITDSGVSGMSDSAVTLECFNYMANNAFMPMIESKAESSDLTSHTGNTTAHITAEERTKWNTAATTASNVSSLVGDTAVSTQISNHNTSDASHNDIRELITGLTTRLNALADSDDTTLDQLSEIVAYIKSNRTLIEEVTTNKVNVSDIIDNLTTNVSNKPLSAAQGVAIKSLIDNLQTAVNGKADSEHIHDVATTSTAGFMSPEGKVKLDGIETGANKTIVDSALSSTSTNPVQNKVVNSAISNLNTLVGDTSVSEQISTATSGMAKTDLTNIDNATFKSKVEASGFSSGTQVQIVIWPNEITFYINSNNGDGRVTLTCEEGDTWEDCASKIAKIGVSGNNATYDGMELYTDSSCTNVVLKTATVIAGATYYQE